MRFGVLGPLAVWRADGTAIRIPDLKVRVLLADLLVGLLVQEGRPVSVDRLAEALWHGRPPGNPVNTLQTKVSQLRRTLEEAEPGGRDLVVYQPPGYLLRAERDAVDVQRFRDLVALAHQTEVPHTRAALLAEALGLWRGPALADFGEEEFARTTIARLEQQRLTALEIHAEARLELGQHRLLADELGELVAQNPLRERLRATYMRALYRAGRQSQALATYGELREDLARELGLDPSPELTALHLAILKQDPTLARPPAPSRRSGSARICPCRSPTWWAGRKPSPKWAGCSAQDGWSRSPAPAGSARPGSRWRRPRNWSTGSRMGCGWWSWPGSGGRAKRTSRARRLRRS